MIIAKFAGVVILGYLLGSIPFGLLISRYQTKSDVRQYGSGKTGATNVLRTAGKKGAAMTAALDLAKGMLAVVLAGLIINGDYLVVGSFGLGSLAAQAMAGLAAVAGHNWPVFFKFRGGRGVTPFFGGLIILCPIAAVFGAEIIIIGAGLTRYASLGSIAGVVSAYAILIPLTIMNGYPIEYAAYALVGAVIIIITHRDNIGRLVNGTERKLSKKVNVKGLPS
ncbi:glycerol-3-phosphate 1-O-acyltransferase PlsY [Chloroflexota bacterium]